jgi:alkylated DNA repair dioxygenase AlkB
VTQEHAQGLDQTRVGPDILLQPDFVAAPQALYDHLLGSVVWDERMRARKTASFGVAYNYSQMAYPKTAMPQELAKVGEAIGLRLGFAPNNCLLNFYPDGDSAMGFHSDSAAELAPGTGVAIVSLGGMREIVYRRKGDRNVEFAYPLESGALLFMSDAVQEEWLHAIPKRAGAQARISLTFRRIVEEGAGV